MKDSGSIGFFDSGVGGLTIWKEVTSLLPHESTVYIADSKNAPYGSKSTEEIIDLSVKHTHKLIELGCKIIVVSCNTATTQAIDVLRNKFDIPFIGIEPAVKPAAYASKSSEIGVLATHGTLDSEFFNTTIEKHTSNIHVHTQVGEGLVKAIENGELHSEKTKNILAAHLKELVKYNVDHIVLGCTHYPLLIPMIQEIIGSDVKIVDSGQAVAQQTKKVLEANGLLMSVTNSPTHKLYSSGKMETLKSIVKEIQPKNVQDITYSSLYQSE